MNPASKRLAELDQFLDPVKIAAEGTRFLRSITPIRSGNARRNTIQVGSDIHAAYPYAVPLDQNHSKQTRGQGLIEPTLAHLEEYINQGAK